ncbi:MULTISPECIES: AraC family transcriptional regulator [Sphingobium]|uniref:AraC family transcriptional regulator n=1 Tax=Sphingobium sp. MI1205 TaxID=407020 RepID=UPI0007701B86|nr:AraC family transcriptional regulator [Sphingobium sp. MI1205]AMK19983.1 AraC family transcriptional regulator [Sphingobium sp. MI1205]
MISYQAANVVASSYPAPFAKDPSPRLQSSEPFPAPCLVTRSAIQGPNADPFIPTWKFRQFLEEARAAGLDPHAIMARHGLSAALTQENQLPLSTLGLALSALADEGGLKLGVSLGRKWHLRNFRIFGYALLSSRTFGDFTDHWLGHFDYLGIPLDFESRVDERGWALEMTPRGNIPRSAMLLSILEAATSVFPIYNQLTGHDLQDSYLEICDDDAALAQQLAKATTLPVMIDAGRYALVCPFASRSQIVRPDRLVLTQLIDQQCADIAVEMKGDALLCRLRHALLLSCGRPPKLERMACDLDMSKRTLNRALAQRGWTYTKAVHVYRRDYAFALLRSGEMVAKRIAYTLNFDGVESFRRAFRIWTGATVNEWCFRNLGRSAPRR